MPHAKGMDVASVSISTIASAYLVGHPLCLSLNPENQSSSCSTSAMPLPSLGDYSNQILTFAFYLNFLRLENDEMGFVLRNSRIFPAFCFVDAEHVHTK